MGKQILLPPAVKSEIMKTFKVDKWALGRALKYEASSPRAMMLRKAALQRGGLIYNDKAYRKDFTPDCDTAFDREKGVMRQTMPNGITLEVGTADGTAVVYSRGEEIMRVEKMTLCDWSRILFGLQTIMDKCC